MSSVNYQKMQKSARAGIAAIIAHNSTDTRIAKDHSNQDIDKSRTADNWQLYDMGYRDTYEKFLSRIKEIDSVVDGNGKQVCNQRSNRVEAMFLEIPYPPDYKSLSQDQQDAWRDGVVNYLRHEFGDNNIIQAWVHVDEVHTYKDKFSGEYVESRPHIHALVVPESKTKPNHLDAKALTLKINMKKRNRTIDDYTKQEYGIKFMTGEKAHKMRVEDLKRIEDAETQIKQAEARAAEAEKQAQQTITEMEKKEMDALERTTATLQQIDTDIQNTRAAAEAEKQEIKNDAIAFRQQAVEYKEKQKKKIKDAIKDEVQAEREAAREQIAEYRQQTAQEQAYFAQAVKRNDFYDRLDDLQPKITPPKIERLEIRKYKGMSLVDNNDLDKLEKFANEAAKQLSIVPAAMEMIEAAAEDVHADNQIESVDEMRTDALASRAAEKAERVHDDRDLDDWQIGDD